MEHGTCVASGQAVSTTSFGEAPIGEGQTIEEERRSAEAQEGGARELQKP